MAKITRKELKKDDLATEVTRTYEYVQEQRDKLIRIGSIVLAAVVLLMGGYFFVQYRQRRAAEDLASAMRVFYAPIAVDPASAPPGLAFKTERDKLAQAEKEFAAVADKYSWQKTGQIARYYLGVTKRQLGKTEEAARELRVSAESRDDEVATLARFALAETYAESGKLGDAEKLYREVATRDHIVVPRDSALLALADKLAPTKPAEAEKIYQDISKQKSGAAAETAQMRLAELKRIKN